MDALLSSALPVCGRPPSTIPGTSATVDSSGPERVHTHQSVISSRKHTRVSSCVCGGGVGGQEGGGGGGGSSSGAARVVPPCKVCGAQASGIHFGVTTCEPCKTFFRRALLRKVSPKCEYSNNCIIRPTKRLNCAACRLQKCKDVGMCRENIKTGRYSLKRIADNMKELSELQSTQKHPREAVIVAPVSTSSTQQSSAAVSVITARPPTAQHPHPHPDADSLCGIDVPTYSGIVHPMKAEAPREVMLEKLIEQVMHIHVATEKARLPSTMWKIYMKEGNYLEEKRLETELFGVKSKLSREEYRSIYQQTGIDADGRRRLLSDIAHAYQSRLNTLMSFIYALPGFLHLPAVDQNQVLYESLFYRLIFLYSHWFNTDQLLITCPAVGSGEDLVINADDLAVFIDDPHDRQEFWQMQKYIQKLDLTEEESLITAALAALTSVTEPSETGRPIISSAIDYTGEALYYLTHKNHDVEDQTFSRIISVFYRMKEYHPYRQLAQMHFLEDSQGLELPAAISDFCKIM